MNKVIICGLGALGITFADKIEGKCVDLRILADKKRIEKYKANPPIFNGREKRFNYLLPTDKFDADLIIITTKAQGLDSAIEYIKNFVSSNTIIISLINGISSEKKIKNAYPFAKVIKSYFIGHSAVREGNSVTQDGIGEIVIEHNESIENFFDMVGINYSVPEDINYSVWLKFVFNIFSNQTSAILNMTFGELKQNKNFINFARKIIKEIKIIAEKEGIKNAEKLEEDAIKLLDKMCDEGKTSMLQDILAKRQTEADIFSGEIVKLGEEYNIQTPYNQVLYDLIKIKEEQNEHSIHSGQGRK